MVVVDGRLMDPRIKLKLYGSLERGPMPKVNGIVIHQTDGPTAQSTLDGYGAGAEAGAHFLIDKDGTIYQTARITQKTLHVGNIKSRCYETHTCMIPEGRKTSREYDILAGPTGKKFFPKAMHQFEMKKHYPDRYPSNTDSIGIEVAGRVDKAKGVYEGPTNVQAIAIKFLVEELETLLVLTDRDLYPHSEVSYKNTTEARSIMPFLKGR
jgi:N-acetyl-anhydromuramyl-L-alanine amidase AmpD